MCDDEKTRLNPKAKSCGTCANCIKMHDNDWACEEYGFYYVGLPVHCEPPNDDPCDYWTDDPNKANTWMRHV